MAAVCNWNGHTEMDYSHILQAAPHAEAKQPPMHTQDTQIQRRRIIRPSKMVAWAQTPSGFIACTTIPTPETTQTHRTCTRHSKRQNTPKHSPSPSHHRTQAAAPKRRSGEDKHTQAPPEPQTKATTAQYRQGIGGLRRNSKLTQSLHRPASLRGMCHKPLPTPHHTPCTIHPMHSTGLLRHDSPMRPTIHTTTHDIACNGRR